MSLKRCCLTSSARFSRHCDALGLSPTQVKGINRALIEAGLITMKDSPNGKRYGRRDRQGRITEAYGFDLSPMAARHADRSLREKRPIANISRTSVAGR